LNGVNVAWLPEEVTAPPTGLFEESRTKKVAVLIVAGSTGSLKIARMEDSTAIPLAPLSGLVVLTCGGAVSGSRVTTIESRPTFPAPSIEVTVIELAPMARGMLVAFQNTKTKRKQLRPRLALPVAPVELLDQVT
jgi:hypothetical protein